MSKRQPRPPRVCEICTKPLGDVRANRRFCGSDACYTQAQRLRTYGLTPEEWREAWRTQEGRCEICSRTEYVGVDHNHKTGEFRGLLCIRCNVLVGHLEKPERRVLYGALDYINRTTNDSKRLFGLLERIGA